jgi:hypothetical protein
MQGLQSERKLTPEFSTLEWKKIEQLNAPKSVVAPMEEGVQNMERHLELEGEYQNKIGKRKKTRRVMNIILLLCFIGVAINAAIVPPQSSDTPPIMMPIFVSYFWIWVIATAILSSRRSLLDKSLEAICNKMNVDYHSTMPNIDKNNSGGGFFAPLYISTHWIVIILLVIFYTMLFMIIVPIKINKYAKRKMSITAFSYEATAVYFNETYLPSVATAN